MVLDSLLGPPDGSDEAGRARRAAIVRLHLLTIVGAAFLIAALPIIPGSSERRLVIAALLLVTAALAWVPLRLGHLRLASLICILDFIALVFGASAFAGGVRAPAFSALLVVSAAAAVLLTWRAAVLASVVGILGGFILLQLELDGRLPATTIVHTPETTFGALALFLILITAPLVVSSRRQSQLVERLKVELAERRCAESRLRESERRLKAILDNTSGSLALLSTDGRIIATNRQAIDAVGAQSDGLVGRSAVEMPWVVNNPNAASWLRVAIPRAAVGEHSRQTFADPDGSGAPRQYEVELRPVGDESGQISYLLVETHDVTEMLALVRMKDQFLAVAAHELKTPVAIMKGYAQALLRIEEAGGDMPRRRLLLAIDRGANRIDHVVRNLLDASRLQSGQLELEMEMLALPDLVADIADRFALTAPTHHLAIEAAAPLPVVRGDRCRLEQAFAGVIDNAIRYSPSGGDVRITIGEAGGEVIVSVRDQGIGIPAGAQLRVFERFFRAHTGTPYDYGGMGVGLYIAREIISRHGGRIWLDSIEGAGSTFHIALPPAN